LKKVLLLSIAVILVISTVIAGCAAPPTTEPAPPEAVPEVEVFNWDMQTLLPAGMPHQAVFEAFKDRVRTASAGRLNITVHPAGAIVDTFEMFDAVSEGVFEMYFANPIYWSGIDPAFAAIVDLPTAYNEAWQKLGWYYEGGGIELARDLYADYNLYYVAPIVAVWAGGVNSKKKLSSFEDFEGLLIRAPHGMMADVLTKAGASVVTVPGGEVYLALERGLVEAAQWGTPSEHVAMGWHEITDYFLYPIPWYQVNAVELTVNMDAWNSLPEDLQAILTSESRLLGEHYMYWCGTADFEAIQLMIDSGIEFIPFPEEAVPQFEALAMEVWDEWAEQSPAAAEIIESQKAYLKRIGRIQ